jgi:hypothetical protein
VEEILRVKKSPLERGALQGRGVSDAREQPQHLPSTSLPPSSKEGQSSTHLEKQIDELVFELYDLTEGEIAVILS